MLQICVVRSKRRTVNDRFVSLAANGVDALKSFCPSHTKPKYKDPRHLSTEKGRVFPFVHVMPVPGEPNERIVVGTVPSEGKSIS